MRSIEQLEDVKKSRRSGDRSNSEGYLDRLSPMLPSHYRELLHNLIQLNPYLRWSAQECLDMEVFSGLADQRERVTTQSSTPTSTNTGDEYGELEFPKLLHSAYKSKILLEVDKEGVFDYEDPSPSADFAKYSESDYRAMLRKQQTRCLLQKKIKVSQFQN